MYRYVMFGSGAVGSILGGRLFESGEEVLLVARGAHGDSINQKGLVVKSPAGTTTLRVPVVESIAEVQFRADDVVVLGMKTQDVFDALQLLANVAPPEMPIVCMQNGLETERFALRFFSNVYALVVVGALTYLSPGIVEERSAPVSAILDIGRFPHGTDAFVNEFMRALNSATFVTHVHEDIQRYLNAKLLMILSNTVRALVGPGNGGDAVVQRSLEEAERIFRAVGLDFVGTDEWSTGRVDILRPMDGRPAGGSTWQSLVRSVGSVESDYLNGEIVLLGRLHGMATPVNDLLCRLIRQVAYHHGQPGAYTESELLALIDAEVN